MKKPEQVSVIAHFLFLGVEGGEEAFGQEVWVARTVNKFNVLAIATDDMLSEQ
jgi:hypothetical protein